VNNEEKTIDEDEILMNEPEMKCDEEIIFTMPETVKNKNKKVSVKVEKIILTRYYTL
jgi:hypothetical protein